MKSSNHTAYTSVANTDIHNYSGIDNTNTTTTTTTRNNTEERDISTSWTPQPPQMLDDTTVIDIDDDNNYNDATTNAPFDNDDDGDDDDDTEGNNIHGTEQRRRNSSTRRQQYHSLPTTTMMMMNNSSTGSATGSSHHIPRHGWMMIVTLLFALMISFIYIYTLQNQISSGATIPANGASPTTITTTTTPTTQITYDPSVTNIEWNPFHINLTAEQELYANDIYLNYDDGSNNDNNKNQQQQPQPSVFGYMMQPNIVQNQIAFVSQGDLFLTTIPSSSSKASSSLNQTTMMMTAIRLTVTIGNVRHPKINPVYPYLIAYTATYQARRDVYVLDVRRLSWTSGGGSGGNVPAQRLTYVDSANGIATLVGWSHHGTVLTYSTTSVQVGLRDVRLYDIAIAHLPAPLPPKSEPYSPLQVLEIRPIPLSQATDGVRLSKVVTTVDGGNDDDAEEDDGCIIFVRYKQGSHTSRYVGGTTEQLWLYCDNEPYSIPLTNDYTGTSKQPTIYNYNGHTTSTTTTKNSKNNNQRYLFFISDRTYSNATTTTNGVTPIGSKIFHSPNQQWRATTMNLWAVVLPNDLTDLYTIHRTAVSKQKASSSTAAVVTTIFPPETMIQLTQISCQFNGMSLQEYTLDTTGNSGGIVLRIGADVYHLPSDVIEARLYNNNGSANKKKPTVTSTTKDKPVLLPIQVLSDYYEQQERIIDVNLPHKYGRLDVFTTHYESISLLMTIRGQVWVAPVLTDISVNDVVPYEGSAGYNIPPRRYRVIPGSMTGGATRVLAALHIPLFTDASSSNTTTTTTTTNNNNNTSADTVGANPNQRLSLVLSTDPMSATNEHAFYIVEIQSDLINQFNDLNHWPVPFIGGHVNGGSTKDGGLGTVREYSIKVSPCGRRFAWTDTDDRICVMTMPIYNKDGDTRTFHCLPSTNDQGEPLSGTLSSMKWSPGGRYLGIEHNAVNQFSIISIVDCGNPETERGDAVADISVGPVIQVTPSRFNSFAFTWGKSPFDMFWSNFVTGLGHPASADVSKTLYFVSDRDIVSDVKSPWGSRAPLPHFPSNEGHVYALPLPVKSTTDGSDPLNARYPGGGVAELFYDDISAFTRAATAANDVHRHRTMHESLMRHLARVLNGRKLREDDANIVTRYLQNLLTPDTNETATTPSSPFPQDADLDLPITFNDLSLARKAYRIPRIPKGKYASLSQTLDDGSFTLLQQDEKKDYLLRYFSANPFPSDVLDDYTVSGVYDYHESTSGKHLCIIASSGETTVVSKTSSGLSSFIGDISWVRNQADVNGMAISVWPTLEYRQMYSDAWRLLRDFFYDSNMHNVNWPEVHTRYAPLLQRCGKREELDDVLGQMASETSALHSFVYGGEYNSPDPPPLEPASLGAFMKRTPEWKGYMIEEIPLRDPDFDLVNGIPIYCPISDQALRPTGQHGLAVGDVIVAVNGESVLTVPDINMMLRGTAGRSIRLEVLRLASGKMNASNTTTASMESLVVVPISTDSADALRYNAWEWKTRGLAKTLANHSGFSVGYIHMQAMNRDGEDAFARGYYPDYDKDALILDVRHNMGGNIDSWIISTLQRKAFMFWAPRSGDKRFGQLDWDEQFAFRGKVIVLVDELTASNGEGVARGISELGLGRLIGTRTWGGGIWGSSANTLVDGGIAAAPQWGIFNDKFGWGGGIEMTGVEPDIVVDNDPHMTFNGRDMQLERAIAELSAWLKSDPIPAYKTPDGGRPDKSLHDDCPA